MDDKKKPFVFQKGIFSPPPLVALVGGLGKMGAVFAALFEKSGCRVSIIDKPDFSKTNENVDKGGKDKEQSSSHLSSHLSQSKKIISQSDIVVLAAPLSQMDKVIRQYVPHISKGALLLDIASVKQIFLEQMIAFAGEGVEIIGAHPLFGPYPKIEGQRIVLCPVANTACGNASAVNATDGNPSDENSSNGNAAFEKATDENAPYGNSSNRNSANRNGNSLDGNFSPGDAKKFKWFDIIKAFLSHHKLLQITCDAKTHDENVALTQSLLHAILFSLVGAVGKKKKTMEQVLEFTTPLFKIESDLAARLLSQEGSLYADIAFKNPNTLDAMKSFREVFDGFIKCLEQKDSLVYQAMIEELRPTFVSLEAACENSRKWVENSPVDLEKDLSASIKE